MSDISIRRNVSAACYGSLTLVANIMVHALILGKGKALFDDRTRASFKLQEARDIGTGVVLLRYRL